MRNHHKPSPPANKPASHLSRQLQTVWPMILPEDYPKWPGIPAPAKSRIQRLATTAKESRCGRERSRCGTGHVHRSEIADFATRIDATHPLVEEWSGEALEPLRSGINAI